MEIPRKGGKNRVKTETEMILRREKEFKHDQYWGDADRYYKHWDNNNTKFEEWTSPRYYDESNKSYADLKSKREKEEFVQKRREKLMKLYAEDEKSNNLELMVQSTKPKPKPKERSTEVLREINEDIKLKEETKRKVEAEKKLYQHWRENNPILRNFERRYATRDLKLSWLDQQIEKQMKKEKEEEERKRFIKERDEIQKKQREREIRLQKEAKERCLLLSNVLDEQVRDLNLKNHLEKELKAREAEEVTRRVKLDELKEKKIAEHRRREACEVALYNMKQHKLKLHKKVSDIQERLKFEQDIIQKIKELELVEAFEDSAKKEETKQQLEQYVGIVKQHEELEKRRQKQLDFIFDSEAKMVFETQCQQWEREEGLRKNLLDDVLKTIDQQVQENIRKANERQKTVLNEKEELLKQIQSYNEELEQMKKAELNKKVMTRQMLDEELKLKEARKEEDKNLRVKEINKELDAIRKEEEYLQKEILEIQKRQGPYRPRIRSRIVM